MTEDKSSRVTTRRVFLAKALAGGAASLAIPRPLIAAGDESPHNDSGRVGGMSSATDTETPESSRTRSTLIGNVYPLKQGAIAFILDDKTGIVLDFGFNPEGRPGSTAPDFSYGVWSYPSKEAHLTVEWGRTPFDGAVFRVRSDRPVTLEMTLPANPWRPFQHYFSSVDGGVDALAVTSGGEFLPWRLRTDPWPEQSNLALSTSGSVSVKLVADQTLRIAAGYGHLPDLAKIDSILDVARLQYSLGRASAEGDWGNFVTAIADNLNNNRLYSSLTGKLANVVGRSGWLIEDPDYLPYFTWDTSFNALLASIEDPRTAMESIRTVLRYQLPNGMVSQLADWHGGQSGVVNMGNSNPPVTSLCAWKIYEHWGNRDFLAEVYPRLLKWHDWWPNYSDGNQNGLLEWGSTSGWKLALLSTGWDDTPHFDGSKMVGTQMNADAVDLNSLWSLDAEILGRMAGVLGLEADRRRLEAEHREMNRRMNEELWNEELGLYCSRLWSENGKPGAFLKRITPMNFYPLLCGAPDARKAERLLNTLTDPKKFWGEWPVPTLPYDDPEYFKQTYWKGHVWGPVNYLIWQGVKRYGSDRSQAELARRSVELFMRNWTAHGTCNENYFSTDGTGDDHPHYTWGALLCRIGIEALWDITVEGKPTERQNSALTERVELRNMPAGGKLYRISSKEGRVSITLESSVLPAWVE